MFDENKKNNIALVISNLGLGGAENQVVEIANNLDKSLFNVYIFLLSPYMPLKGRLKDLSVINVIEKRWKFDVNVIFGLARQFRKYKIDIVHGFLFDAEIASRFAGRLAGCKLIIGSERNTANRRGWFKKSLYRYTSRMVDLCIANSSAGAEFHQSITGLPRSCYRVVHNGVDSSRFYPADRDGLRSAIGIDPDSNVIGMFGSFKKQKNHELLFRAARYILKEEPGTRFLIVGGAIYEGDGDTHSYAHHLFDVLNGLGISDSFLFVGHQDAVEDYYNICDVTVLPSLHEGTPNVVLESMCCGVPVVVTDVSDNTYIVPDGKAGYIVPVDDERALAQAVLKLITDRSRRERMGRNARNWVVSEFSVEKMVEKIANVYISSLDHC